MLTYRQKQYVRLVKDNKGFDINLLSKTMGISKSRVYQIRSSTNEKCMQITLQRLQPYRYL